jgi:hypothetical protein
MTYTVALIGSKGINDSEAKAAERRFRVLLETNLDDVEQTYRAWLDANNTIFIGSGEGEISLANLAVQRWICAYTQARLISLAAFRGDCSEAWFDIRVHQSLLV